MGTFLIALITGVAAGALTARSIVRHELGRLPQPAAPPPQPPPMPAPVAAAPIPAVPVQPKEEEIPADILPVLAAAVAAFLGKRARIRSARVAPVRPASAWAQQGRVFVQASHNLPTHRSAL